MKIENKLETLGLKLPEITTPIGSYVPVKRVGNLIFVSGQAPFVQGKSIYSGKIGSNLTKEQGYEAARVCGLNILALLKAETGSLDNIKQIVSVRGYVACENNFFEHPYIINGVSDLFLELFGEAGKHARVAIGTNVLPVDIPVEVEIVAEIK